MHIAHYESAWGPRAILELPFDAYIDTNFHTITVQLKGRFDIWALPPKQEWAFDIDDYVKRHAKGRRRKARNRKSAVTAF
jgi:hypothetical protein